ncbi:MAG: hypothetical protein M3070_09295 [Actinomycetota bacterium]|nr:hypothetical protein [Actinomycetota bacterium]
MFDVHDLNPDVLAAELAWRRESLSRRAGAYTLPRWRTHPSSRSRVVRRRK